MRLKIPFPSYRWLKVRKVNRIIKKIDEQIKTFETLQRIWAKRYELAIEHKLGPNARSFKKTFEDIYSERSNLTIIKSIFEAFEENMRKSTSHEEIDLIDKKVDLKNQEIESRVKKINILIEEKNDEYVSLRRK